MIRKFAIALVLTAFIGMIPASGTLLAAEMKQTECPVMGYKPNPELYTDYKGKRVYFCCAACPQEFKRNPEKYMKKLDEKGVELEDAPGKK